VPFGGGVRGLSGCAGVVYDPDDLVAALIRLEDSGRLMRPRPKPTRERPNPQPALLLACSPAGFSQYTDRFDRIDALAESGNG
jgi:hypothetical protein